MNCVLGHSRKVIVQITLLMNKYLNSTLKLCGHTLLTSQRQRSSCLRMLLEPMPIIDNIVSVWFSTSPCFTRMLYANRLSGATCLAFITICYHMRLSFRHFDTPTSRVSSTRLDQRMVTKRQNNLPCIADFPSESREKCSTKFRRIRSKHMTIVVKGRTFSGCSCE